MQTFQRSLLHSYHANDGKLLPNGATVIFSIPQFRSQSIHSAVITDKTFLPEARAYKMGVQYNYVTSISYRNRLYLLLITLSYLVRLYITFALYSASLKTCYTGLLNNQQINKTKRTANILLRRSTLVSR